MSGWSDGLLLRIHRLNLRRVYTCERNATRDFFLSLPPLPPSLSFRPSLYPFPFLALPSPFSPFFFALLRLGSSLFSTLSPSDFLLSRAG